MISQYWTNKLVLHERNWGKIERLLDSLDDLTKMLTKFLRTPFKQISKPAAGFRLSEIAFQIQRAALKLKIRYGITILAWKTINYLTDRCKTKSNKNTDNSDADIESSGLKNTEMWSLYI